MRSTLLLAATTVVTQCSISKERVGNSITSLDSSIFKTNLEVGERGTLFQGDIVTEIQGEEFWKNVSGAREKRQVLKDHRYPATIWQDGVSYTFNTSDQFVHEIFKTGAKVWSDNTCIDFMENGTAKDKVVVVKENESWSSIGRIGGVQFLSLHEKATGGLAVHEIGHVLGLIHTMSRYDRDDYIRIVVENVNPRHMANFIKMSKNVTEAYGLTYDYGSIMHYDDLSGSINKNRTIIARDPHHQRTMGSGFVSFSDIFMINEHYGCIAKCNKTTSAKCENEGFPHPRNCSICICPSGYGGALCDRRPPGCGEDLLAKDMKQMVNGLVGSGTGHRDYFDFCNYMITAPEGKKIEIEVLSISRRYNRAGCRRGGVEIKAQNDQKLVGYRYESTRGSSVPVLIPYVFAFSFCSINGTEGPIVSSSNRLPVILYSKFGTMQAVFMYRYIN